MTHVNYIGSFWVSSGLSLKRQMKLESDKTDKEWISFLQVFMSLPEIKLAFDPGASLTKCVYSINSGEPQLLTMEPEVITVPLDLISRLHLGPPRPQDHAWIQLDKDASEVQVCGFFAQQFPTVDRIDLLKYEQALYKSLAAVGAIAVQAGIDRFSLKLSGVLPYSEMANAAQLEESLRKRIKKFYFQKKLLRGVVDVNSIAFTVEGTGLAWDLIRHKGMNWFTDERIVVALILGYRNLSCLTFNRGAVQKQHSGTSNLGFVRMVDGVISRTAGQDRQTLTNKLYKLGANISLGQSDLRMLIKSTLPENIEVEAKALANAITVSRKEYWQSVSTWLDTVIPTEVHTLVVSGGTGLYLKPELEQYLKWADPTWFSSQLGALSRSNAETQCRFADVASLFESTLQTTKQTA